MRLSLIVVPLIAGWLCACSAVSARPLVLGSISEKPSEEIQLFFPLADYLARQLGSSGVTAGKVVVANDLREMVKLIEAGKVDLYIDSPFPIVAVSRATGTLIELRRWKKGKAEYRSVIVVKTDSPIRSLEELRGKVIAFENNYSTSGYLLPKSALLKLGVTLREHTGNAGSPSEIGYMFSNDDGNTVLQVLRDRVSAGAMGIHDLDKLSARERTQLRVIHETSTVPRQLVSFRKDLPAPLRARLREVLIGMEHTKDGREVLNHFEATTRFDPLPETLDKALAPLLVLKAEIDRELKRQ